VPIFALTNKSVTLKIKNMNARIDARLIPNGICATEMEVAHYLNGSHCYAEDLHSVIRKFASRLNQCYFLKLNTKVKKLMKSLYPDNCIFLDREKYIVLINRQDLMPVTIDQLNEQSFALSEEILMLEMKNAFHEYLKIGDVSRWNRFCRWLLIAYGLWATKTGFMDDLRLKYGDDFYLRRDLYI